MPNIQLEWFSVGEFASCVGCKMRLECDPDRPGDLYLNGALFASIHPGQARLAAKPGLKLVSLAEELARRWNDGIIVSDDDNKEI